MFTGATVRAEEHLHPETKNSVGFDTQSFCEHFLVKKILDNFKNRTSKCRRY
jgi:hypothetical protein